MSIYGQHNISSVEDLERLIPYMHMAERRNVHIEGQSSEKIQWKHHKDTDTYSPIYPDNYWERDLHAVVNVTTGRPVQGTGPLYQVLQHKDYFSMICDLLRTKGFNRCEGYAVESNGGNRWHVRVIFPDVGIVEQGVPGKNIRVGGEFSNSYDSFYAARGRAYFMRASCWNQMIFSNIIPKCFFTKNHVAEDTNELLEKVTVHSEAFVRNLMKSGVDFKHIMKRAMENEIVFEKKEQLEEAMQDVFKVQMHANSIAEIAWQNFASRDRPTDPYRINLWDLYGASTYYASHEDLTVAVQDSILYRAEQKILKNRVEMPPMVAVA